MKYALVDGRIDTTVFKGTVIAVEFDSVGVLVAIDLIDVDSHESVIPPYIKIIYTLCETRVGWKGICGEPFARFR